MAMFELMTIIIIAVMFNKQEFSSYAVQIC